MEHHPVVGHRHFDAACARARGAEGHASSGCARAARSWPTLISGTISHSGARLASSPASA